MGQLLASREVRRVDETELVVFVVDIEVNLTGQELIHKLLAILWDFPIRSLWASAWTNRITDNHQTVQICLSLLELF